MVFLFIWTVCPKIIIDVHRRTEPLAFIDIKCCQAVVSRLNFPGLLPEGKKQVLLQPPVQKRTDLRHFLYGKPGNLPKLKLWFYSSGNNPILGIFIEKYFQLVPGLHALRHLLPRKEHPLLFGGILRQIDSKIHLLYYCQYLCLS